MLPEISFVSASYKRHASGFPKPSCICCTTQENTLRDMIYNTHPLKPNLTGLRRPPEIIERTICGLPLLRVCFSLTSWDVSLDSTDCLYGHLLCVFLRCEMVLHCLSRSWSMVWQDSLSRPKRSRYSLEVSVAQATAGLGI